MWACVSISFFCVCVFCNVYLLSKQFINWQLIMMLCIVYWCSPYFKLKRDKLGWLYYKLLPKIPTHVITCQLKFWNRFFHVISLSWTLFVYFELLDLCCSWIHQLMFFCSLWILRNTSLLFKLRKYENVFFFCFYTIDMCTCISSSGVFFWLLTCFYLYRLIWQLLCTWLMKTWRL